MNDTELYNILREEIKPVPVRLQSASAQRRLMTRLEVRSSLLMPHLTGA